MPYKVQDPETDLYFALPGSGDTWHPHTIYTHLFGFSVPEASLSAFIYVRCLPAFPLTQGGVAIFRGLDNVVPTDIDHLNYEMAMPWPEFEGRTLTTSNGLRVEFLEPGRQVRITYDSGDGTSFDVVQTAVTNLIERPYVMPGEEIHSDPALMPGGSEQFMSSTGDLVVNGERFTIDCHSVRDRSWGQVRTERRGAVVVPPVGWSPMYFGEDLAFNQTSFEPADTDPAWTGLYSMDPDRPTHNHGWVYTDGQAWKLTRVRRNVLKYHPTMHMPVRQEIDAEDELGRTFHFSGEAVAMAALPMWPNATFHDSLFRWTDEQGRTSHITYQELWFAEYQRAMTRRGAR